jgi:SNF2 family DNA or RNA helicase
MKDFVTLCQFLGAEKSDVQRRYDWYRDNLVLRRTKDSVCEFNERLRLPPCDFQNIELEMYPEEKELYNEVFENSQEVVKGLANTQLNQQMMHIMECMLRCRQVLIWPQMYYDGMAKKDQTEDPEVWTGRSKKMETLLSMIDEHPTEASLVFCQFMGEMDYIQEQLQKRERVVYRFDGRSTKEEREAIIKSYKEDSQYWGPVLLIQIKAGGVGLNLQEATRVYITSPAWNPATELQAIGRAHRTGQVKNVVIRKLVYNGEEGLPSIEESIMELQGHKAVVCGEVLNDQTFAAKLPKTVKSRMTVRELRRIFAQ